MPPAPKAELGPEAECPGHLLICDLYKFPCCPVPQFPQKRVGRGLGRGLAAQGMPVLQACSFRGTPSGDPAGTRQSPVPTAPSDASGGHQMAPARCSASPGAGGAAPRHGTRCLCPRPDAPSREFTPLIAARCPLRAAVTQPAVSSASPAPSRQAKPVGSGWERSSGKRRRQRQGQRGAAPRSLHCSGPRRPLWEWAWPGTLGSTF